MRFCKCFYMFLYDFICVYFWSLLWHEFQEVSVAFSPFCLRRHGWFGKAPRRISKVLSVKSAAADGLRRHGGRRFSWSSGSLIKTTPYRTGAAADWLRRRGGWLKFPDLKAEVARFNGGIRFQLLILPPTRFSCSLRPLSFLSSIFVQFHQFPPINHGSFINSCCFYPNPEYE